MTKARLSVVPGSGKTEKTNEAQALADILIWSKDCPKWQRDALRRLCLKNELDQDDINELAVLCESKGKGSIPLTAEHIPDPKAATTTVCLRGINGIENVNALKEGEHRTFDKAGMTVVYGDNGSGKSGYARVLKKVCRARSPKGDDILPNIYADNSGPQKAVIEFTANGQNKTQNWMGKKAGEPLLSSVSVFDSRTASVHVDAVNDVAYTPFPMKALERLADACQEIKKRITESIRELEQRQPAIIASPRCHPHTAVGKFIAKLNGGTMEKDVRDLATLNEKDKTRLEALRADLGSDPAKAARQVEALRTRLDGITNTLSSIHNAVSVERVQMLGRLYQDYQAARGAAASAAEDLFGNEPLPDVGSDVWRALWEAARTYSEQQAYPRMPFPVTENDARCVLCQQELDAEAVGRLVRFERFVQDETKQREAAARTVYQAARDAMKDTNVAASRIRELVALIQDELSDKVLAQSVRRAAVTAKWRLRAILRHHISMHKAVTLPNAEAWPTEALAKLNAVLLERIAALRADDKSDERRRMRAAYDELVDREWLAGIQEDVIAEIGRRQKIAALNDILKDTGTSRITTMSGDVAEKLVTNALRAKFSKEIDRLGMAGLAIEFRKEKSSYGVPRFRVGLIRKPNAHVGDVLSEGEHRCVALAAFFTELATTEGRSAIVFDDPVSSLDHMHREAVAERIADEGQHRQIVVFTHDIAFLFLLDQACREKGTHIAFRCITRSDDYAGFCQQDPPARAQPIEKVIEGMQKQLNNEKVLYNNGDHIGWERTVDALQKRLRWTWERAVEEAVAPVIKRLSNKVETKGLAKVTTLTIDDCMRMRQAYGRCSNLLHSSADALNSPLPKTEVVENEITVLRKWVTDIKARQDKVAWLN